MRRTPEERERRERIAAMVLVPLVTLAEAEGWPDDLTAGSALCYADALIAALDAEDE